MASIENETYAEASIYYTYEQTGGVPNVFARALGDTTITKLWVNNILLTKVAGRDDLDADHEWYSSGDSAYVYLLTASEANSLYADVFGPMITVSADSVTVAGLILRHSNKSGIRVSGANALIANSLFDSSAVGGSAVGNGSQWANNIFRAIADTALAVYGTSVTNTTNAAVSGSNDDGLVSPLTLASYDPADPGQAVNGVGTDVGFGDDIGPVPVMDLATVVSKIRLPFTQNNPIPLFDNKRYFLRVFDFNH
jgi:hypothetical protein